MSVNAHNKARMQDPAVLRQRQLIFDPEIESNTEQREAIVELTLTDGTQLPEHKTAVRGNAANPMTREKWLPNRGDLITLSWGLQLPPNLLLEFWTWRI